MTVDRILRGVGIAATALVFLAWIETSPVRLAAVSSEGRGYVAFTDEEGGRTLLREVDGLHIVGEWELTEFRARSLELLHETGEVLIRGVPAGQVEADHFLTRLYATEGGELVSRWTSESLAPEVRRSAEVGVSPDGRTWFAARADAAELTLSVGAVGSALPEWRWTAEAGGVPIVRFLDREGSRLVVERGHELTLVERGESPARVLPRPAECPGGVSQVQVGEEALWAICQTLDLGGPELEDLGPEPLAERLREASLRHDGQDLYVAYPVESLDTPIVFGARSFVPGAVTTLWVTPEGAAIVDATSGEVRGLEVDGGGRRVLPSSLRGRLDERFVSGQAPAEAPFADLGWRGSALVDLDAEGGVEAFVSLARLGSTPDER